MITGQESLNTALLIQKCGTSLDMHRRKQWSAERQCRAEVCRGGKNQLGRKCWRAFPSHGSRGWAGRSASAGAQPARPFPRAAPEPRRGRGTTLRSCWSEMLVSFPCCPGWSGALTLQVPWGDGEPPYQRIAQRLRAVCCSMSPQRPPND